MGHSVSKGRRTAQNDSLVRDVTYLREQISKHEKAYDELQQQHEQLKNKVTKQTQDFEKVKKENIYLKKALSLASVTPNGEAVSQGKLTLQSISLPHDFYHELILFNNSYSPLGAGCMFEQAAQER